MQRSGARDFTCLTPHATLEHGRACRDASTGRNCWPGPSTETAWGALRESPRRRFLEGLYEAGQGQLRALSGICLRARS